MAGKDIAVKKYVVRLGAEEREQLQALIGKGKSPAKRLLKARILLKADISAAGEGWSDSRIIEALDTSAAMIYRVRKQLVEEGFEAVLSRKPRMTPPVAAIFDGEKEAKLIALACSKPPKGRARWTLRLLENKVVELGIVERATSRTSRPSCWSRTISISTARHRSTRPFRRPRPGGWSSASNGTTRPSTAVGLTSPNPNSGFYPPNASIGAFPTNRPSLRKSPPGKTTATPITPRQTGNSQP